MRIAAVLSFLALTAPPLTTSAQDMGTPAPPSLEMEGLFRGARTEQALVAQVLLDHARHSPGVIDGVMGSNTVRAIRAYQRANGDEVDGALSAQLLTKLQSAYSGAILQRYTIAEEDVAGPFITVTSSMEEQAQLDALSYETAAEALAEKFHMSEDFLRALNPEAEFKAATQITVVVPRTGALGEKVTRIEIDKEASALRAFSSEGKLLATYPATIGSGTFPSPHGVMEVRAIAPTSTYYFDPTGREWGPDQRLTIAAGPNNPVGGTWIDLTEEGYGIHGTPEPKLIGKTSSHGCVRLTNWDAEQLAKSVAPGTVVEFI